MKARVFGKCGFLLTLAAAFLLTAVIAACGSSAEPTAEAPEATTESATAPPTTAGGDPGSASSGEVEPQGDVAPKFTLPSATGDSVSLSTFAGDRNVVLVFYRGFW